MENGYGLGYHDRPHENVDIHDFSQKVVWNTINHLNYPFQDIFARPIGEDVRKILYDDNRTAKIELSVISRLVPNWASLQEDELVYEATFSVEEKQDNSLNEALISAAYEVYKRDKEEWAGIQPKTEGLEAEEDDEDEPVDDEYEDDGPEWDDMAMEMSDVWLIKKYKFKRVINRFTRQYEDSFNNVESSYQLQNDEGQSLFNDGQIFNEETEQESLTEGNSVEVISDLENLAAVTLSVEEAKHLVNSLLKVGIPAAWLAQWTGSA